MKNTVSVIDKNSTLRYVDSDVSQGFLIVEQIDQTLPFSGMRN